jgi:hypothetical protein
MTFWNYREFILFCTLLTDDYHYYYPLLGKIFVEDSSWSRPHIPSIRLFIIMGSHQRAISSVSLDSAAMSIFYFLLWTSLSLTQCAKIMRNIRPSYRCIPEVLGNYFSVDQHLEVGDWKLKNEVLPLPSFWQPSADQLDMGLLIGFPSVLCHFPSPPFLISETLCKNKLPAHNPSLRAFLFEETKVRTCTSRFLPKIFLLSGWCELLQVSQV